MSSQLTTEEVDALTGAELADAFLAIITDPWWVSRMFAGEARVMERIHEQVIAAASPTSEASE